MPKCCGDRDNERSFLGWRGWNAQCMWMHTFLFIGWKWGCKIKIMNVAIKGCQGLRDLKPQATI